MAVALVLLLGFVGFVVFWIRHITSYRERTLAKIPAPPSVPILGHVQLMFFRDTYDAYGKVIKYAKEIGSPLRLKLFNLTRIEVFRYEDFETLMKSNTNIQKGFIYDTLIPWLGRGLLISTGQKWFHRRKQLTPSFHFSILCDFVPLMNEHAAVLLDVLSKHAGGPATNINPFMTNCTLDIICETAMGTKLDAQLHQSPYTIALHKFADLAVDRAMKPWYRPDFTLYITPLGREIRKHLAVMKKFTNDVIQERINYRAKAKEGEGTGAADSLKKRRKAFLDTVLDLHDQGAMTLKEVQEEVDTFMFEGHDTTATAMMWNVFCAARYPEAQERLHEEVDAHFGAGTEGPVTADDVGQLKYMEMFIKEVQRMYPSVPVISRDIVEEVELGGYTIPVGSEVFMHMYIAHRDPEVFPEPERFDPERFLPGADKRNPYAFVPFSAGPRNCIGQKFAMLEEKILLTQMMRAFKFSTSQTEADARPGPTLVLKPLNGAMLKIERRF